MMDIIIGPRPKVQAPLPVVIDDFDRCAAQAVIAHPSLYSTEMQRSACVWLMSYGDWLDYERASALLTAILRDWDAKEQARVERKVWRATKWFLVVALAVVLGICLGKAIEKAVGQYNHDVALATDRAVP